MAKPDTDKIKEFVHQEFERSVIPTLSRYIEVPSASVLFDPEWETNGLLDETMGLLAGWVRSQDLRGVTVTELKDAGRSPFLLVEVAGSQAEDQRTVLLYAHQDKQPPLDGQWSPGLGPRKPVIRDGKLYGRGGADDGYGVFAAVLAIKSLQVQGVPHAPCKIVVESGEESGSPDLAYYLEKVSDRIGTPRVLVCLDSGCGDYNALWLTTSLRGMIVGTLRASGLACGVHSGASTGVAVESTRVIRLLLERLESMETGRMIDDLYVDIPERHVRGARDAAAVLGESVWRSLPLLDGVKPAGSDPVDLLLGKTWRPTLAVTGADGLPSLSQAGNVNRQSTALKLSIRLPPTADPVRCEQAVRRALLSDPPYGFHVSFETEKCSGGWAAPDPSPWLDEAVESASRTFFGGRPAGYIGEGGGVPFVGALAAQFPGIEFVVTGVLGPHSNAHGPDEFLHLEMAENVTCCVASILADHCARSHLLSGSPRSPRSPRSARGSKRTRE